jgi:hypothetical protein
MIVRVDESADFVDLLWNFLFSTFHLKISQQISTHKSHRKLRTEEINEPSKNEKPYNQEPPINLSVTSLQNI